MASTIGRILSKLRFPIPISLGGTGSDTGISQPNLLINSGFLYNGRGFAGGALTAGSYGYDRWGAYIGGANYTVSAGIITIVSGVICQPIESPGLAGQVVTFSADGITSTLTVTIGTSTTNVSGTITAGTGRKSLTLTIPSALTSDIQVRLGGTNCSFKEPKFEWGPVATPYQKPIVVEELLAVSRYYQNWDGAFTLSASGPIANCNKQTIPQMFGTPTILQTTSGTGAQWITQTFGRSLSQLGVHSVDSGTSLLRITAELTCTN